MVKEVDAPCFLKPLFTLAVGHKSSCRGCRLTGTLWDQGCRVDEHWNAEPGDSQGVLCRAERTGSRHVELVSAQLWDPGAEHPSAPHTCQEHSHQLEGRSKAGGRGTAGRIIYLRGARGTHGPALCLHTQGLLFLSHNHSKNKDV